MLLALFSSIWLGVTLLALLFVYCSIGSAGMPIGDGVLKPPFILRPDAWVPVREEFELSEFEWFHIWPFKLLIALICANIVVATLRRIPFNVVNLGVWMIHTGIITLAAGSVWYFSTKVEGESPVARRMIVARLPGAAAEPATMIASPGNRMRVGAGADAYVLQVQSITPDWEMLSGDDAGDRAYKVSVLVQSPQRTFVRELLAGYPQYTEDLVRSDDPSQPFARAKKTLGTPLVDERLELALDYAPQEYLYVHETSAIYLREVGSAKWVERPIEGLPMFRDHLSSRDLVWDGEAITTLRPIDVAVPPVAPDDPLPDVMLRVSDYLRVAVVETRRRAGGDRFDPIASLRLDTADGRSESFDLLALHPEHRQVGGGVIEFRAIQSEGELAPLREVRPATLGIRVPPAETTLEVPIAATSQGDPDLPFTPIDGTPYRYRVKSFQDELAIGSTVVSLAIVEVQRGDESFIRWAFDDPSLTRDLPDEETASHAGARELDAGIEMIYKPGRRSGVRLVAGPAEDELRLLVPGVAERPVTIGAPMPLRSDLTLTVTRYDPRSVQEARPRVIPPEQRDRDDRRFNSLVRLHVPAGGFEATAWLAYHYYAFERPQDVLRRFRFEPTIVRLSDGRQVEMLFSRQRVRLPAPVVLDDFELTEHIGGYTGQTTSIRNWTSIVRFAAEDGWSAPVDVSVNEPRENAGFWYFQSQWDPPTAPAGAGDSGSAGLNYTVLGVGNREGVNVQLAGCIIAVIGMIYAFYVKPAIKRRRMAAVHAEIAARALMTPDGAVRAPGGEARAETAGAALPARQDRA
jgi:hypothetical protein